MSASPTTADLFALSLLDLAASLPPRSLAATPLDWGNAAIAPPVAARTQPGFFNRRTGALAGAAIATVAGTSLIRLADQPATYEGKFQLLVEPAGTTESTAQAAAQSAAQQATLAAPSLDYASQMQVLWSPKLLAPVVQQLQTQYADLTYETLSQKLEITHQDGEKTLSIAYQDTDPKKVQAVLDTVSQTYLQYSQACRKSLCRELNFVEQRLPQLKTQVTIAQQNLQQLQQRYDIREPQALGQQLSQRSSVLLQQRQDLQIRLTEARTQLAILQSRLGQPDGLAAQWLSQNDRYRLLLSQFQAIADQLAVELARPQPDATRLQTLKQRYQQVSVQMTEAAQQPIAAQLTQAISDFQANKTTDYAQVSRQQTVLEWVTAANQVQLLEISQQAIVQTEAHVNQQIKAWAVLSRQYDELNLELKFATDNLDLYEAKRAELQTFVQPKSGWQLAEAPAVEQISHSFSLSDAEHRLSLGLMLSVLLVILVMSIAEQTKPNRLPRRQPSVQPESWQPQPWQATGISEQLATLSTLPQPPIAMPLHHKRTALFLLTAATRLERVPVSLVS